MTVYHDEVEIEDFEYDEDEDLYTYPCVSIQNLIELLLNFKVGKFKNNKIEKMNHEIKFTDGNISDFISALW